MAADDQGLSGDDGPVTQSPDTSPEIEALQVARWRAMEPWEKIAIVRSLNRLVDGAAVAGIRERHPEADAREVRMRLAALRYGRDFTADVLGWDPDVQGW